MARTIEILDPVVRAIAVQENIRIPQVAFFPVESEKFSNQEEEIVLQNFTNAYGSVYALKIKDQEVAGALLSRFSRTNLAPRKLFLKEFWGDPKQGVEIIKSHLLEKYGDLGLTEEQAKLDAEEMYSQFKEGEKLEEEKGKKRKQEFFHVVYADYGDASVIQMGGIHIIFENPSQIAAKAIEDARVASAYIEESSRYVPLGEQIDGRFRHMDPPAIMRSKFAGEYKSWANNCFESYVKASKITKEYLRNKSPLEEVEFVDKTSGQVVKFKDVHDPDTIKRLAKAYESALTGKTLDLVRGFFPMTLVLKIGAFYSGQAAEHIINKLIASPYEEVQVLGLQALEEASKVTYSFLEGARGEHGKIQRKYLRNYRSKREFATSQTFPEIEKSKRNPRVRLIDFDPDADVKIAAQLVYESMDGSKSKNDILAWAKKVKAEELKEDPSKKYSSRLAELIVASVPTIEEGAKSRMQKLGRAFEDAMVEWDLHTDIGGFRDLQRNRMSRTEREKFTAEEQFTPTEYYEPGMEEVFNLHIKIGEETRELNRKIANADDESVRVESEYIATLNNKVRYSIRMTVRQLAFFGAIRSSEQGHTAYRFAAQSGVKQSLLAYPFLRPLFGHMNWKRNVGFGRLRAEIKKEEKLAKLV